MASLLNVSIPHLVINRYCWAKSLLCYEIDDLQVFSAHHFAVNYKQNIFLDEGIAYQQVYVRKRLEIYANGLVHLRRRISS